MKFDGFPGEKELLSFRLTNGYGWVTTHYLIIQEEKHSRRFNIIMKQFPDFYLLRDFEKAVIEDDTLFAYFKGWKMAVIRLPVYSPSLLKEVKDYIEEAAKYYKWPLFRSSDKALPHIKNPKDLVFVNVENKGESKVGLEISWEQYEKLNEAVKEMDTPFRSPETLGLFE